MRKIEKKVRKLLLEQIEELCNANIEMIEHAKNISNPGESFNKNFEIINKSIVEISG